MAAALALARRGLGQVAPNPAVGCVLVRDGRVVGRGWTQPGGRPHAETEALRRAGDAARGATAYVSLEPCSHHGKTPPCCDALIAAGVTRCLIALEDPDPRVAGAGTAALRAAGLEVSVGLLAEAAAEVNAGYLLRQTEGRPLVTLKLATTLDGRIATAEGESRWITGPEARARGHLLRARHDAVMVGGATALLDDPRLDVRLPGLAGRKPLRIVLDSRLRLPLEHDLVARSRVQATLVVATDTADEAAAAAVTAAGCEVLRLAADDGGHPCLVGLLEALGQRGLNSLLVEGGGRLAAALLRRDLVDRLVWFRAPKIIGGDGTSAVAALGLAGLDGAPRFELVESGQAGDDGVETYRRCL